MKFIEKDGLRYLTFDLFGEQVIHGVFTRHGGLSPSPWDSLNAGGTVGDDVERVRENRFRSFAALGRDRTSMFDVWQVHSADVVIANAPHRIIGSAGHSLTNWRRSLVPGEFKADAIITDNPQVTLYMRFADCTPVLLYDPVKKVVGIVHAGWQGTVKKAPAEAVRMMAAAYGSAPEDILAAIGPSIGPDHYEVGDTVIEQVAYAFGENSGLLIPHGKRFHFDLWSANQLALTEAGVQKIEVAGLCTACNTQDWYSHRAEKGKTGRFGAIIALRGVEEENGHV